MNTLPPFVPTHPGDILKEELEYRGITQKHFAELTGISYTMLNEILNCKCSVTADFALLVEAATGINAEMLMNMQTRYNLQMARKDTKNIARFKKLQKICASLM